MAQVFLSYDREDGAKARLIAQALERAGHFVWWDRHITGGAQYAKEIEQALGRADAVVVLWSAGSVESAWVRDEAAAGRDTGRLVPVRLDDTEPPMGFRQYQVVDFSRRGVRSRDRSMAELLRAIDAVCSPDAAKASPRPRPRQASPRLWAGLAAALALTVAALLLWQFWRPKDDVPSVTITASEDSAPARALAGDLLVKLGSLQASRADGLHLLEPDSGEDADFAFKVGAPAGTGDPRANLALVNRDGTLLWSREFVQPGGNEADLRQQLAYSAGQVLRCATEALAPDHPRIGSVTLKLYLNACAELSDQLAQDASLVIPTLRQITDKAPRFSGGWGKLVLAEMTAYRRSNFSDAALRKALRAHIDKARKLHPQIAEPALAEAWLQEPRPISGWMRFAEEAVAKDPSHAEALINRATGLLHLGLMRDAVADARRAARAEPLYPAARESLVDVLMTSGQTEAALKELREAERLWPGASNLVNLRFNLSYRYGDPKEALEILQSGKLGLAPRPQQMSYIDARLDPSPAKIEKAIGDALSAYRAGESGAFSLYVQTLAIFGRQEPAMNELLTADPRKEPGIIWALFRPYFRPLWRDPRFMVIMKRYEVIPYWQETGKWPDFCSEPDFPYDCKTEAAKLI